MLVSKIKSITNGRVITKDSKVKDGLENYVDTLLESKGLRNAYQWEMGTMTVTDFKHADDIVNALNSSKEFGTATYNPTTKKITIGRYKDSKDGGPGSGRKPEGGSAEPGGKNKFYKGRGNTVHKGHMIYETRKNTDYPPHYVVKNKKFNTHAEAVAHINTLGSKAGPAKGYKGKPSGWSRFAKLSPEEKKAEVKNALHKR